MRALLGLFLASPAVASHCRTSSQCFARALQAVERQRRESGKISPHSALFSRARKVPGFWIEDLQLVKLHARQAA